jgi:hypothetical protein
VIVSEFEDQAFAGEIGAQTKEAVEAIRTALGAATANNARASLLAAVAGSWHNHYETRCKGH